MLKRSLLVAVVLSLCSTSVYAQQVFVSFGQGANASSTGGFDIVDGSGSAFIYSAADFQFDAFDLEFSTADDSVIQFTNAEVFNSQIAIGGTLVGVRWDDPQVANVFDTTSGELLGVGITEEGINPNFAAFDEDFDALALNPLGVGPAGSFLLARIDYDIVGTGTADITLEIGEQEFITLVPEPDELLRPTLGSGMLTVTTVPEPSTMGILTLGLVGFVTRRRR